MTKITTYMIRDLDPETLSPVERASRFLYLNKTGYNGLWRVNSKGQFNVPFGRYKNPKILDYENLKRVRDALSGVTLICGDFSIVLEHATDRTFVYFDPPYQPISETSKFTNYVSDAFTTEDQIRLSEVFRELDSKGCLLMLSNSDTEFIRKLYAGYNITTVYARRSINCKADGRGNVSEVVIRNYD